MISERNTSMPGITPDATPGAGGELETGVWVHAAIAKSAGATAEDLIILSVRAWRALAQVR